MVKLLYRWDDRKFDEEYLKKLEKNWNKWKNNRKEGEKEYMEKLEESLEWNEKDKQMSKRIWSCKCCLLLIFLLYPYIIITPM